MTLSRRGDYVMRAAISLAHGFEAGVPRKIREVVADTEVPQSFASQILADLVRADIATSRAGRSGGYRLARPPEDISVLEIVESAEGPLRSSRCALGDGPCRWDAVCPLHETWTEATTALRDLLARTSLAVLARRDAELAAGTYTVPSGAHRSHPVSVGVVDAVQVELPAAALDSAMSWTRRELLGLVRRAVADTATTPSQGRAGRPRVVDASLGPPAGKGRPPARHQLGFLLAHAGHRERADLDLTPVAIDPQRTELQLEGTWHQESSGSDLLSAAELEERARLVTRSLLRTLARALEVRATAV
ncbi:MAG: Rrf2 family transcriptional regulator [Actinomycetota bacterium]|nr:Rrf2 family transcriptional regulator [Actinomycetota bacterium]